MFGSFQKPGYQEFLNERREIRERYKIKIKTASSRIDQQELKTECARVLDEHEQAFKNK